MLLWPGRWPVVWSLRWRRLRSSVALAWPRNCWPLYSTPSPVQPALLGVPEPRWLLPDLRQKPLRLGGPLCSHQEGGRLSLSQSSYLFPDVLPSTFCLCYRPLAFFPFSFFKKNYLFYVYEYTVTVFRHTRRGHQIPLQVVGSHHVVAGN